MSAPSPLQGEGWGEVFFRRLQSAATITQFVNILLIQLKRIGDLILTTPAIVALREKFPDAKLTLVVSPQCAELLPAIPDIDNRLLSSAARTWLEIARGNFDYCIDFTRNDRSAFLVFLSARKNESCRFESKCARSFGRDFTTSLFSTGCATCTRSIIISHCSSRLEFRMRRTRSICRYRRSRAKTPRGYDRRARSGIDSLWFIQAQREPRNFWEPERWAEVVNHAREKHDVDVVLTGGTSPLEQNHIREIKSKIAAAGYRSFRQD